MPHLTTPTSLPLLPGSLIDGCPVVLGVLGGGQLGRMWVHAAQALGYETVVLDPDASSPAGRVSQYFIQADYRDLTALRQLAVATCAIFPSDTALASMVHVPPATVMSPLSPSGMLPAVTAAST